MATAASDAVSTPADADTMKCIHASAIGGDFDEVLTMVDAPKPSADLLKGGKVMIVKVLNPKLPFIPGMDLCGVVEQVAEGSDKFKVGDRIMATNGMMPVGGLAEYAAVQTKCAAKVPPNVSPTEAAVFPNSPIAALNAVQAARVKEGERVMVLGGSGGVGSSILQLVKDAKASFLATTSTAEGLCLSLGADVVIDYRKTNWYEDEKFKATPFDVVIDCIGWRDEWKEAYRRGVLKSGWHGGRYISIAATDEPQVHTVWQIAKMMVPQLWRSGWTCVNLLRPRYKMIISEPVAKDLDELAAMVEAGRLKAVLDPASPFPFTADGVKAAFKLQASKHAHGKVVVTMT
eukprot:g10804.t1